MNGGDWIIDGSVVDSPDNPGQSIFTFELEPNGVLFDMLSGEDVKLFEFNNSYGVYLFPLFLLKNSPSSQIEAIEVSGTSTEGTSEKHFGFSEIYGLNAYECELIIGDGIGLDSLQHVNGTNNYKKEIQIGNDQFSPPTRSLIN